MKNLMNVEEFIKQIDKFVYYNREKSSTFDKIIKRLSEINTNYVTKNYNDLINIKKELSNKFSIIKKNNFNNEIILVNNASKYIQSNKITGALFDDIK